MRTTFSGLEIAKSALFTARSAMDVTSHNIANADTVGYTRQRLSTVSVPASTASTFLKIDNSTTSGRGVNAVSVDQIRNPFLDMQYRERAAALGASTVRANEFAKIESMFNTELEDTETTTGLSSVFGDFYSGLNRLSQDPASTEIRQSVLESAVSITESFNFYYNALTDQQQSLNDSVSAAVESVNSLSEEIAKLSDKIYTYELTGDKANDMRDQRNALLDNLSKIVNVEYTQTSDNRLVVTLGGHTLIDNAKFNKLAAAATKDNSATVPQSGMLYEVYWQGTGESADVSSLTSTNGLSGVHLAQTSGAAAGADATMSLGYSAGTFTLGTLTSTASGFTSGSFAQGGHFRIELSDGGSAKQILEFDVAAGQYADANALGAALSGKSVGIPAGFPGEKAAITDGEIKGYLDMRDGNTSTNKGIPAILDQLNKLAQKIVTDFNAQHEKGYTLHEWDTVHDVSGSVTGVKFFEDFGDVSKVTAGNFAVRDAIVNDVRNIAASDSPVNQKGADNKQTGNNANAKALVALITGTGSSGNFDGAYKTIATGVGIEMDKLNKSSSSNSLLLNQIDSQRQSTSGVSVDEEMTDLIKFTHSFNAASRLITAMDEQLDILINRMGLVGRS